jgi:hypothetical protein
VATSEQVGTLGTVDVTQTITLSDYGAAVSISAPPAESVVTFTELVHLAVTNGVGSTAPTPP